VLSSHRLILWVKFILLQINSMARIYIYKCMILLSADVDPSHIS